jgi:TRAP-type uncharacterized transport system fused permease subunit
MGVGPLAAHLFVFYFGILSAFTPPVATASYAAASVAKDDPMKLGGSRGKSVFRLVLPSCSSSVRSF